MNIKPRRRFKGLIGSGTTAFLLLSLVILPYTAMALSDYKSSGSFSVLEELSGTVVNCMLQDSQGFLWFGTQTGLYRYNGYGLKPYSFRSEIANKFNANFITSLAEDDSHHIWIGTLGGGLFKLNPQSEEYLNFYHQPQNQDSLSENTIRALCQDDSGKLWIGTQNKGLDCLDPVSGQFTNFARSASQAGGTGSNTITSIGLDATGTLWIASAGGGVSRMDPRSSTFHNVQDPLAQPGDLHISRLYIDKSGVLWMVRGEGKLGRLDTASGKILDDDFPELRDLKVTTICEDQAGDLWIGTYGNGVLLLDKDSGKFATRTCDLSSHTCNYRVISLYADSSGNLWLGTEDNGIDKINTNLNFMSYNRNNKAGLAFNDDVILEIYKDRAGIIWLGTANGGINRFDRKNNRVTHYQHDPLDEGSLSSNTVCSIFEDSQGILWFGTIDGTLNRLEPASGKFVHYQIQNLENSDLKDNGILKIQESQDGFLWICVASGGLTRFNRSTGRYTQFTHDPRNPYSISSNHVMSIAQDDSGIIWIGTTRGLNSLDLSSYQMKLYSMNDPESGAPIFDYTVHSMVNDGHILWLASDKGLLRFEKNSEKLVPVNDLKPGATSTIFGLLKDGQDHLWMSSTSGLLKYGIQSNTWEKYDFYNGLQTNKYNTGAYYQSSDGEMFFGGTNGFHCFYADKIKENTHRPPVVLSDIKISDSSVRLDDTAKITLSYQDNHISFEFAALDYADPMKNQYAYKLEGFDRDWHYNGTRNYASYTSLEPGEYLLRVKASNNDGLWNEQETQIKLVITPPFWQTGWFVVALWGSVSAVIISLVKLKTRAANLKSLELERQISERTRELNQVNEQLRQADELKSSFLSMVSHEIRTPLSAILGFTELITARIEKTILPSLDLKDEKIQKTANTIRRDLQIIISEGDRLSTLINNLLNISKIESGEMDWKNETLDISELIEQSLVTTRPISEKNRLSVHVDLDADLPQISGDKDMLTHVFINLVTNALKFTREGYIKICARNAGNEILFSIEDTGMGIEEADLPKIFNRFFKAENHVKRGKNNSMGLGLHICKQIIEKHGGKIWAESQPGKGSTFYFTLPHQ